VNTTLLHTPPRTILEVFESLPEGTRCEVINNTLVMSPAPSDTHQKILGKIFAQLTVYVDDNKLGELRIAPYDVYLSKENIVQPDIVLILNNKSDQIEERGFFGTPDLIIEVLSTSNAGYDKKEKKDLYEKFGVGEYWIIEPFKKLATGFTFVDKKFVRLESKTGIIHSTAFGFTIRF
jgi:Uma2 family endonuclease